MKALKLGEALVKAGLVTQQQLELALQRQVVFGGRIGTNILELRVLDENELTAFLSKYFKVPAVSPDMLASIEDEVINSLERDIIEKYKILPFRKERNRIHAAVLNPKDLKEIDELRFTTGYDIIPYVISELRLIFALEKYYGIKRDLRYISFKDRFSTETEDEEDTIDKVKRAFADARDTDEIAGVLVRAAYKVTERIAIFMIKEGRIKGWKSFGLDVDGFEAGIESIPLFRDIMNRRSYYRGPVPDAHGNEPLVKILSGRPRDAVMIPVNIRERVVALLYADNGTVSVLDANVGYLTKLAMMAAYAFEIVLLRKKIIEL